MSNCYKLISKCSVPQIWNDTPVFSFSCDIDWASEDVIQVFLDEILTLKLKPTLFVTHPSKLIDHYFGMGLFDRGIHPNFLPGSSHGNSFKDVVDTCIEFAPESYGFRSHRAFDVTDITHLLYSKYSFRYMSNQITIMQPFIRPILHESNLINFPVFFEDGTHLYNNLDFDICSFHKLFCSPGLKVISFHPMNFVFNSPSIKFMRGLKDSLTRQEYNNITHKQILAMRNTSVGIHDTILKIIDFVYKYNYPVLSLNELYQTINNSYHENA